MKRLFSFISALLLVFTFSISVGAANLSKVAYGSVVSVPLDSFVSSYSGYDYWVLTYPASDPDVPYFVIIHFNGSEPITFDNGFLKFKAPYETFKLSADKSAWEKVGGHTAFYNQALEGAVIWANTSVYNTDGSVYLNPGEVGEPVCNGSTCSAIDANFDGFCDDCGMSLMSLTRTPVAPAVDGNNKNSVMFYSGTVYKYTVYSSDVTYTIRGEEYGTRYRTYTDPSVTVQRYESYDGINWEQTYTGKTANDYPGEIGYNLISSTFDWYTEAGDHFFPVPLWKEMEQVTQGEMANLTAETAGTMKVLVLSGVGLMALLVVLSLFGKRSLIFLR